MLIEFTCHARTIENRTTMVELVLPEGFLLVILPEGFISKVISLIISLKVKPVSIDEIKCIYLLYYIPSILHIIRKIIVNL